MTHDPDLASLVCAWKQGSPQAPFPGARPARLSHRARWEGRLGLLLTPFFVIFSLGTTISGAVEGNPPRIALGVFVGLLAAALGRSVVGLRARARAADALLAGPPLDVARGYRHQVHTELCATRSPYAIFVTLSPIALYLGLAAYDALPALLAGVSAVGYAGWLVWLYVRTVPRLRAEVVRLDALVVELGG